MREIQASEAKAKLPQLLDDVERGETLVITRHGKAIARLVPEVDDRRARIEAAFAELDKIRKRAGKIGVDEILAMRDEGRRA